MIVTSVSLPESLSPLWQAHQREIMRYCLRIVRLMFYARPVRTGTTRLYTRRNDERCQRVTTRFTEAEHDTLLSVSTKLRVSVSWLIAHLIKLWLKPARRKNCSPYVSNYYLDVNYAGGSGMAVAESIFIWKKIPPHSKPPPS